MQILVFVSFSMECYFWSEHLPRPWTILYNRTGSGNPEDGDIRLNLKEPTDNPAKNQEG